jgi:hypothetical protein
VQEDGTENLKDKQRLVMDTKMKRIAKELIKISRLLLGSTSGFMSDYNSKTFENPLDQSMRVWSYSDKDGERMPMIMTDIEDRRWGGENVIWLNAIISPEKQGTGMASFVLKKITEMADKNDAIIYLTPKPFGRTENALSESKLKAWYKRYGWEKKDSQSMVRYPK